MRDMFTRRAPFYVAIGLLLLAALGVVLTTETGSERPADRTETENLPLRRPGVGHGSFCRVPEHGAYFYGRDMGLRVRSLTAFAAWCETHGGEIGWVE